MGLAARASVARDAWRILALAVILASSAAGAAPADLQTRVHARVRRVLLEHPSLGPTPLVRLLRKDPVAGKEPWHERKLKELLSSGDWPDQAERDRALATSVLSIWRKLPKGTRPASAFAAARRQHPGLDLEGLGRLVELEPALAEGASAMFPDDAPARPPPTTVPAQVLRGVHVAEPELVWALGQPGSPLVARTLAAIRSAEARRGDNDGVLAARDLHGADPLLRDAMDVVYAETGKRNLDLE